MNVIMRKRRGMDRLHQLELPQDAVVVDFAELGAVGRDEEFVDAVLALDVLEHLAWDRWVLQNIQRILKPGGWLILDVPRGVRVKTLVRKSLRFASGRLLTPAVIGGVNRPLREFVLAQPTDDATHYNGRAATWLAHGRRLVKSLGYQLHDASSTERVLLCQKPNSPSFHLTRSWNQNQAAARSRFLRLHASGGASLDEWLRDYGPIDAHSPMLWESQLPLNKRALVLSPHPDDELIGCGGTLLKMRRLGAEVAVLQLTDGGGCTALLDVEPSRRRIVRIEEAKTVARRLGAHLETWREPDSHLQSNDQNVRRMVALLGTFRPDVIFVPFLADPHPDHQATAQILAEALTRSQSVMGRAAIACYEVWGLAPINVVSPIDDFFAERSRCLFEYRTAMKVVDYIAFCESLHGWRGWQFHGRPSYAEGFYVTTAAGFLQLFQNENRGVLASAA